MHGHVNVKFVYFFLTFVEMEKKFPEISATESCAEMESFESRTKDL